jgi:hypothetical protein
VAQTVDEPTPAGRQVTPGAASASVTAPVAPSTEVVPPEREVGTHEAPEPAARRIRRPSRPAQRRTRVTVRRVGPLSVLKFSLIFYFCVMAALLLGLIFLYMIMQAVGAIDAIEELITKFFVQDDGGAFQIDPGYLLPRAFLLGCGMVIVWSFINVMAAFLYNLISDVVGGVEITLAEKK